MDKDDFRLLCGPNGRKTGRTGGYVVVLDTNKDLV